MIVSFGDNETRKVFDQEFSRKIPPDIQKRALFKLLMIDNAESEIDLKIPISNRLEQLKGNLKEYYSIRINDQWRIIFKFKKGNSYEVSITDYH
ncbi:type II toxin-antitoxin system RelE/ParE family toxin [Leptospira sp. GIMC2001]|uniref:type II toxin-antitoxin system RelE/ParE family toxin n=1 Tax=Leptospira sp. GIMC2001 TaxID=1513297 RepID=UPI0023497480|nr:type II toxin-antitoxin system RelE/ParE family toxin [Leptospira sp. GIMC2001]WCL50662.1 type II toxin-antitoxin system RelE/ParE family toxin [Leptospira sp. GIMC2001]